MKANTQDSLINIGSLIEEALKSVIHYIPKIFLAIILFWIGMKVINFIIKYLGKFFESRNYDLTLSGFIKSMSSILLKAALFITIASTLGIATTSFVAILGAAGLAIGLALQGSLANFAGGVMLLIFRPFEVGDYVMAQGIEGFVRDINVFVTKIVTADSITHHVPNGPLSNGNISNLSQEGKVRIHIPVGIAYESNIQVARQTLIDTALKNNMVIAKPPPSVIVTELADSSVNLELMVWCHPVNKPDVEAALKEEVKLALDNAGIDIPYPQQVMRSI